MTEGAKTQGKGVLWVSDLEYAGSFALSRAVDRAQNAVERKGDNLPVALVAVAAAAAMTTKSDRSINQPICQVLHARGR